MNGKEMRMGEFRGEVLTRLEYIKEHQKTLAKELRDLHARFDKQAKTVAVTKWMAGGALAWLSAITTIIVAWFTGR